MFSQHAVLAAVCFCALGRLAYAANPLTDYSAAKPGDPGFVPEDPELAQLVGLRPTSPCDRSMEA